MQQFLAPPSATATADRPTSWRLALCLLLAALATSAFAQEQSAAPLARRGSIGLGLRADETGLMRIAVLRPGGAAERAGLAVGDRLVRLGSAVDPTQESLIALLRQAGGGATLEAIYERGGTRFTTRIRLDETPLEAAQGQCSEAGSVRVPRGYRLRTLLTIPEASPLAKDGRHPAFFFVQGIQCASIDRPTLLEAVDTRLVHEVGRAGFITLRVDKPGLGDSEGPPCSEIGFQEELEGYQAALAALAARPDVDPARIFVFGHSMGGTMAPYLASSGLVRGSMVYGTLARTWFEYVLENLRRQLELNGADPASVTRALHAEARISGMMLIEKKTLGEIWAKHPELRQNDAMADETHLWSRHMTFFHELQDLNIAEAWTLAKGEVLAIHGEYDWVAGFEDHDRIARIAKARSQGPSRVESLPRTDHGFTVHANLEESLRAMGRGTFDGALPRLVLAWMAEVEGRPL